DRRPGGGGAPQSGGGGVREPALRPVLHPRAGGEPARRRAALAARRLASGLTPAVRGFRGRKRVRPRAPSEHVLNRSTISLQLALCGSNPYSGAKSFRACNKVCYTIRAATYEQRANPLLLHTPSHVEPGPRRARCV